MPTPKIPSLKGGRGHEGSALGLLAFAALQLAVDGFANEVEPVLSLTQGGVHLRLRAFRQRQVDVLGPEFFPPHAPGGSVYMNLSQRAPFSCT